MKQKQVCEKFEAVQQKGGKISFTVTDSLLMIHTETMNCQVPRETIVPMVDDAGSHGILRLIDVENLHFGMTLFVKSESLPELVMFLQKYTRSRVVI